MYEYGPPEGKKNPLEKSAEEKEYRFVPLKEQLAGVAKPGTTKQQQQQQQQQQQPVSPPVNKPPLHSEESAVYRTGVLAQAVSPTIALLVSGLLVIFMTVMISYGTTDHRVNILIILGVVFLIFSLVSLFGSHLTSKRHKVPDFFRIFNGLTVGTGLGFILSVLIFMVQLNLM